MGAAFFVGTYIHEVPTRVRGCLLYTSSFALPMQYYLVTYAALILVGVIIGLFGSAIAMRRYLRV